MPTVIYRAHEEAPHDTEYLFWCPGCKCSHRFKSAGDHSSWNGDLTTPTITPSIQVNPGKEQACHVYVTGGVLQFLSDSHHALAGKTVPMEKF